MKKFTLTVLLVFALSLCATNFIMAEDNDDIQAIKKAVKKNPNYKAGKEVKWFKLLVRDTETNKDKVKITLPISIVEFFVKCGHEKHMKIDCDEFEMDFKELFAELKKNGPTALIEVSEGKDLIKIWLE